MDATLGQASKILALFEDTPREQVQALLASGFLADLRDANFGGIEVERDDFRRLLGLKPLTPASPTIVPVIAFKRDMRKEGWKLLEDVKGVADISAGNVELVSFLKDGERSINGEELVSRARGELRSNYGQRYAEDMLEHQDEIPEELRPYILVFTGTIWRDRFGDRSVTYLYWDGERWYLSFCLLDRGFDSSHRLVRPRE